MKVKDVMRTDVVTVEPATSLRDVARILAERGISGVPVVDGDGAVVGVVSEEDIVMKERGPELQQRSRLARLLDPPDPAVTAKLAAQTAGEAMTSPAITVEPGAPVARAAATMVEHGVNRLPVLSDGKLVGIVTRADLVRAFTRTDEEIAREIREDVVLRTFWQTPESVTVSVRDGRVTLGGAVDRRTIADLLVAYVERVPGVLSVDSRLTWREDDRR